MRKREIRLKQRECRGCVNGLENTTSVHLHPVSPALIPLRLLCKSLKVVFICVVGFEATVLLRYQRKKETFRYMLQQLSCVSILVNKTAILVKFLSLY